MSEGPLSSTVRGYVLVGIPLLVAWEASRIAVAKHIQMGWVLLLTAGVAALFFLALERIWHGQINPKRRWMVWAVFLPMVVIMPVAYLLLKWWVNS